MGNERILHNGSGGGSGCNVEGQAGDREVSGWEWKKITAASSTLEQPQPIVNINM